MDNAIERKSFNFAVRIIKLYKYLSSKHTIRPLFEQLLRSGTSIGANVSEALQAQSRADFISKLGIALKETAETKYWINLFVETEYLSLHQANSILKDCIEIEKLLTSIIKSSREMADN